MSTDTNFNTAPFWDDYDPEKGYHRVLFRPGVPVQARELTQLQTILQNQVERFGENVYKDGTIIKGCTFNFDPQYYYIKLLDLQVDGQPVNPSMFQGTILVNSANVQSSVVNFADGLESQNPNLNTLFIKYLNAGTNGQRAYSPGDIISAYGADYPIQNLTVTTTGNGYSNNDTLVFSSTTGSAAAGRIVTDNTGKIQNAILTNPGKGYKTPVSVAIANSTGGTANGSGGAIAADTVIAQLTVAGNSFITAGGGNTQYQTVGAGYSFSVTEGTVFQKGFFIHVEPQTTVVTKYTTSPNDVSVGFTTTEAVVNNSVDQSLLDLAQGEPNYSAPGAFRLKLSPTLTVKTTAEVESANTFLALASFQEGRVINSRPGTEFNSISIEMARRTAEESGNYVVNPFSMYTDDIHANTSHIQLRTSSGVAYVNGYRVEQLDTNAVPLRKGNDLQSADNISISTNYSNFIYVENLTGTVPFNNAAEITLRDVNSNPIGTARARAIVFDSGARYRVYLFNIEMSGGAKFADVRSYYYNDGLGGATGTLVLENGKAVLQEPSFAAAVFPLGRKAVKTIRNVNNTNDTSFIYITNDTGVSFSAGGTLQKNLTGNEIFPYNGTLNDIEERDVIFIARNSANSSVSSSGTIATTSGSAVVTGSGTAFLTDYAVGDYLAWSGNVGKIAAIASNTSLTLAAIVGASASGLTHVKHFPAGQVIPFTSRSARTIAVSGGQQTLTATLGHGLSTTLNVTAIYNIQRNTALQLTKNYNSNLKVKISTATQGSLTQWCLGVPDAAKIVSVTKTTNADYVTGAVDVTSHFELQNGQMETHYGLSYIAKRPGSNLTIANNEYYVVTFNAFTHTNTGGGAGFFSIDSYPIDDTSAANTATTIKTQDVPVFVSPTSGKSFDLRDCVDFRPVAANTVVLTSNLASANVNPTAAETFSATEKHFPAPNKSFSADLQHYLGRYDKVAIASTGQLTIIEGSATNDPTPPQDLDGAMTIATIAIPPYPTLSTKSGTAAKRPDYVTKVLTKQTRRYTMADIGKLDARVRNMEYYTALNLLEKQTADLNIPSADGGDRFKNGIFVDPFTDFSVGNVIDGEFTAGIDEAAGELIPRFEQSKFDLKIANTTSAVVSGDIVTLPYDDQPFIVQPYSSRVRNCVENYWSFAGKLTLFPSYDNFYEVRTSPQNAVTINIDNASSTLSLLDELNNIRAINSPVTSTTTTTGAPSLVGSGTSSNTSGTILTETYEIISTTTTTTAHNILSGTVKETTQNVGDFVTDVSFSPFMREQAVHFKAFGLKPNSRLYAFFDKVSVSHLCRPCDYAVPSYLLGSVKGDDTRFWQPTGAMGEKLYANEQGEVYGIFYLPKDTFFVGDREFKLMDVGSMAANSSASTSAGTTFHAYNFSASKTDIVVSTRSVEVDTSTSSTSTTSTSRSTEDRTSFTPNPPAPEPPPAPGGGGGGGWEDPIDDDWGWWNSWEAMMFVGGRDPIAQTFTLSKDLAAGQEGVFISRLDLFFQRKDPNMGITVEIRLVENGYPSATVVPMGRKHLTAVEVNVSEIGNVSTPVEFDAPIFLKADQEYAFVVLPDANSPEYLIHTAVVGQNDSVNPATAIRMNWGSGVMFTSTNNSAWTAHQDEDIKFVLYRARFTANEGTVTLVNKDDEFLTANNISGSGFVHGENVFKHRAPVAGTISCSNTSSVITGVGTSFLSTFGPGKHIVIANTATGNLGSSFDVFEVASVSNNTSLTVLGIPTFTVTGAKAIATAVGKAYLYEPTDMRLQVSDSTANSTVYITPGDVLVGDVSGTQFTVSSVDNRTISYLQPLIYRTAVTGTNLSASIALADTALADRGSMPLKFNDTNYLPQYEAVVASRSNEIVTAGGAKSVRVPVTLKTNSTTISPTVDLQACSILRYKNLINDIVVGETGSQGQAVSKYVSKTIVLRDGQDAEDLKAYITAYKPAGTSIDVYARLLHSSDSEFLRDKTWTKLAEVGDSVYCDSANRYDFREFEFELPEAPETTAVSGTVSTNGTATVTSTFDATTQLAVGNVLKIVNGPNVRIVQVTSITNATTFMVNQALPWTGSGLTVEKFVNNEAAFRDPSNLNIISYYNGSSLFETYKTFAIKIVLRAASSNRVPRLRDARALALSV